jgi:addiction module HigA family antidote
VLNGKAAISADMAVRLAAALGGIDESWLHVRANHDLWRAASSWIQPVPMAGGDLGGRN